MAVSTKGTGKVENCKEKESFVTSVVILMRVFEGEGEKVISLR